MLKRIIDRKNERYRRKSADFIRRMELEQMSEHEPIASAKRQMEHRPYQSVAMIKVKNIKKDGVKTCISNI